MRNRAGARPVGHAGQLAQQLGHVVGVGGVLAGVAGGAHAGRAAEGVDLEAGVVGHRRLARSPPPAPAPSAGRCPRSVSPFSSTSGTSAGGARSSKPAPQDGRRSRRPCPGWRWRGRAARRSSSGRGGGGAASSVGLERRRSRRCRCSARSSRSSSSARVNGRPSAVPCTSTNRPPPVMTTFMSTSARDVLRRRRGRAAARRRRCRPRWRRRPPSAGARRCGPLPTSRVQRVVQRHVAAADRRRAGAAVGLEDVAVDARSGARPGPPCR